jgi:hypothetical protein
MRVQILAAELAVERFNDGIVGGFSRSGEVQRDVALVSPQIEVARDELAALVNPGSPWEADLAADRSNAGGAN